MAEVWRGRGRGRGRLLTMSLAADDYPPPRPSSPGLPPPPSQPDPEAGSQASPAAAPVPPAASLPVPSQTTPPPKPAPQLMHSERTEAPAPTRRGISGGKIPICTNFLKFSIAPGKGLFEHHVEFAPLQDSIKKCKKILHSLSGIPEPRTFDGAKLSLAEPLTQLGEEATFVTPDPFDDGVSVTVKIRLVRQIPLEVAVHFYNILLRRVMELTGLAQINRSHYDTSDHWHMPLVQHKLEIWRGYDTAADRYEGGLMVCIETCHRVLAQTTILEYMKSIQNSKREAWQAEFKEKVIGRSVLTRYNNVFYRIDDVDFQSNPNTTFLMQKLNKHISFVDYYRTRYGATLADLSQPLLISRNKPTRANPNGIGDPILLVPELCFMTGLTDEIRKNFNIMKDLIQRTRITPLQRIQNLKAFAARLYGNQKAMELMHKWGLQLESMPVEVDGRLIPGPEIQFCDIKRVAPSDNQFSYITTSKPAYRVVPLKPWALLCSANDRELAIKFADTYKNIAGALGIQFHPPDIHIVPGTGSPVNIKNHIKANIKQGQIQFVVIIMSLSRDDSYAAAKQKCLVENSIPSQVILAKTLRQDNKFRGIVQKIALQINCKLGGANWALVTPEDSRIMFVGIDTYHDPKRKNKSVVAMVGSMNSECTQFCSRAAFQASHMELADKLGPLFHEIIVAYKNHNPTQQPKRIVVFRDGISDGQHDHVRQIEIPALKKIMALWGWKLFDKASQDNQTGRVKFTFVITQKRINERLFLMKQPRGSVFDNPTPGTIVDHTVTRRGEYDFFLVSQSVHQGTVTPTHYYVLDDGGENNPNLIQKLTFFMTYMYFNWPGSIRVPAVCQYAHKLAYLAGQHLKAEPKVENQLNLFYL